MHFPKQDSSRHSSVPPHFLPAFPYRLALCGLCLIAAVAGILFVFEVHTPLSARSVQPEVITVWVAMGPDADETDACAMYEKLAEGFARSEPGCGVNVRLFTPDAFAASLSRLAETSEAPAVLMNTTDPLAEQYAVRLTPLTNAAEDVYVTDLSAFKTAMPLGCSYPALYCNTYYTPLPETAAWGELPASTPSDSSAKPFLPDGTAVTDCFSAFLEDGRHPVLASSAKMGTLSRSVQSAGAVQMMPVSVNGTCPVQYELYCMVSRQVSRNARLVGMRWLHYLLTEEAQEILFVEHSSYLPLHRTALAQMQAVQPGLNMPPVLEQQTEEVS